MKKGQLIVFTVTLLSVTILFGSVSFAAASTGYNDDFTSPPLSSIWTTSGNAGATYDLSTNPGWLRVTSPAGCDLGAGNDDAPRVLQPVSGDFQAIIKVSGVFTAVGTHAGLLVFIDNNHFMRVEVRDNNAVQIGGKNGGAFTSTKVNLGSAVNPIYLKMVKAGSSVTGYWSSDGSTWTQMGTAYTLTGSDPVQLGLFVINQNTGVPSFSADFDYFYIPTSSLFVLPESPLGTIAIPIAMGAAFIIYTKRTGRKAK
jgi:regulation of enolase protein 1 (concanavalin A-like superfamily)